MSIVIVSAGLNTPSSTSSLSLMLERELSLFEEAKILNLRPLASDIMNALLTGFPSGKLGEDISSVVQAKALVAVTPVYSGSYSGLFKIFFDLFEKDSLRNKPVLLAATGGTSRHSLVLDHSLRPLFAYFNAIPAPRGVFASTDDFATKDLKQRVEETAKDFLGFIPSTPPTPTSGFVSFADMLK